MYNSKKPYKLICEICFNPFVSHVNTTKSCSDACRLQRNNNMNGLGINRTEINISHGTVGAISELLVSADLMKRGYSVFRALSPACFCDLIAIKDGICLNIEVRTGYIYKPTNHLIFPSKIRGKITCFGIYVSSTNEIRYLDINKKVFKI